MGEGRARGEGLQNGRWGGESKGLPLHKKSVWGGGSKRFGHADFIMVIKRKH